MNGKYYCPCVNCLNVRRQSIELIREHLLCDGFLKSYRTWTWHGEVVNLSSIPQSEESNVIAFFCTSVPFLSSYPAHKLLQLNIVLLLITDALQYITGQCQNTASDGIFTQLHTQVHIPELLNQL